MLSLSLIFRLLVKIDLDVYKSLIQSLKLMESLNLKKFKDQLKKLRNCPINIFKGTNSKKNYLRPLAFNKACL